MTSSVAFRTKLRTYMFNDILPFFFSFNRLKTFLLFVFVYLQDPLGNQPIG